MEVYFFASHGFVDLGCLILLVMDVVLRHAFYMNDCPGAKLLPVD